MAKTGSQDYNFLHPGCWDEEIDPGIAITTMKKLQLTVSVGFCSRINWPGAAGGAVTSASSTSSGCFPAPRRCDMSSISGMSSDTSNHSYTTKQHQLTHHSIYTPHLYIQASRYLMDHCSPISDVIFSVCVRPAVTNFLCHATVSAHTGCAKKQPNLFLSKLCQISTKFDNFWHTDSQDDRNM